MPLINSLLVRSSAGWSERTDAGSITANTRFEAYLALGAAQTEDGVNAYADAQLDLYAIPREEVTAGIAPISTVDLPYVGYRVGDTVTVPNSAGAPTVQRVRGITVTENADTGIAVYTPTFKDLILERAEQIEVAIKKMSNGTLGGSSQVAQPIRQQFFPREVFFDDGSSSGPFVVVADDGTGDFTSIKDAIETVATETVIYVKPATADYTDIGAGRVTLDSGKKVTVFALFAEDYASGITTSGQQTTWSFDGFTGTGGTTYVRFIGLDMRGPGATTLMWSGGASYAAFFDNCDVSSFRLLGGFAGAFYGDQSRFVSTSTISTTLTSLTLVDCNTRLAATLTLGAVQVHGGRFGGAVTLVSSAGIGNQTTFVEFASVVFFETGSITMSAFSWAAIKSCSNLFQQGTGVVQLGSVTVDQLDVGGILVMSGNLFPNTAIIARTASVNDATGCVIEGIYGSITTNIRRSSITGEIWEDSAATGLLFETGADECLAVVTFKEEGTGGGFTVGVQFDAGADNNVVIAQGLSDAATPISDSGTGNVVNGLPPSGAAGGDLSGAYPNPSVVDDSHAHTAATLSGVIESGDAAGGDLSGTYPNPSVVDDSHTHTTGTLPATLVLTDGTRDFTAQQDFNEGFRVQDGSNEYMGVATLIGGTLTVANTKILTGSRVFLSVVVAGGTQGFLSLGTVVNATSFDINSTSGTETSTVAWLIVNPA